MMDDVEVKHPENVADGPVKHHSSVYPEFGFPFPTRLIHGSEFHLKLFGELPVRCEHFLVGRIWIFRWRSGFVRFQDVEANLQSADNRPEQFTGCWRFWVGAVVRFGLWHLMKNRSRDVGFQYKALSVIFKIVHYDYASLPAGTRFESAW